MDVLSPIRIDHHVHVLLLLCLSSLRLALRVMLLLHLLLLLGVVVEALRVSARHRLPGAWPAIALRHHDPIDPIELNLVLLVQ